MGRHSYLRVLLGRDHHAEALEGRAGPEASHQLVVYLHSSDVSWFALVVPPEPYDVGRGTIGYAPRLSEILDEDPDVRVSVLTYR